MNLLDGLGKLRDIRDECGMESLGDAADYCLLHWNAFDIEFIRFCERYLDRMEEEQNAPSQIDQARIKSSKAKN